MLSIKPKTTKVISLVYFTHKACYLSIIEWLKKTRAPVQFYSSSTGIGLGNDSVISVF